MTHLRIENENNIPEIVNSNIIQKLYELVYDIDLNLEEELLLLDYVSLKGNLLSNHGRQGALTYLNDKTKFPNLLITVPIGAEYIDFADSLVELILSSKNIGDGVGITLTDLYAINTFDGSWFSSSSITSFNELQYFKSSALVLSSLFLNCSYLTEITFPSGITNIPALICKECSSLTSVSNVETVTNVGSLAFSACSSLENINLPNVTQLGNNCFSGCSSLISVGNMSPTTLGNNAFTNCTSLLSIDLSSTTTINQYAFMGCSLLTSVDLSNVTSMGEGAFKQCIALTSIDLSNITTVGGSSSYGAFQGCIGLTTVTNLNKTGLYMFYGCTGLTTVGLTSNCTSIALNAFLGCTSLTSIDLSNVTSIGGACFNNCNSLGVGLDLDINLDNVSVDGHSNTFKGVGYRSITLHETSKHNITNFSGSGQYDTFGAHCANLIKFDLSDTKLTGSAGSLYSDAMTTLIYPETLTSLALRGRDYGTSLLYIICLSRQLSDISTSTYWEWNSVPGACAIYVWDDVFDTYIQMSGWLVLYNIGKVKKISQLPSSVTWYTKEHPTT